MPSASDHGVTRRDWCARCRSNLAYQRARATGRYDIYPVRARTDLGAFMIEAALLFLEARPREPVPVTPRQLDAHFRRAPWSWTPRHLPHVDPGKPGLAATIAYPGRRPFVTLIEGFHRAALHRRDRTPWSWHVLDARESFSIMAPLCDCRRGVKA